MEMIKFDPKHVFAVRERSQFEKDNNFPLTNVREAEVFELKNITQGNNQHFGLGLNSLSKQLVKINHD